MTWHRSLVGGALFIAALVHPSSPPPSADAMGILPVAERVPGTLSVMSYNVKGLPWPIASGRTQALGSIGNRLARLRRQGKQPHIVLLQEAFTDTAKAIGTIAGYRYIAEGPQPDSSPAPNADHPGGPVSAQFARGASWLKGETEGKWTGSGLIILSDFPISAVKHYTFPQGMCAGFDCLSAKGAVLAWVTLPELAKPVAVVDTHLNSRGHTGVSLARADAAFALQIAALRQFVRRSVPQDRPVIFAGDFNFGHASQRLKLAHRHGGPLPGSQEALRHALTSGFVNAKARSDALAIAAKGSDRQYFRSSANTRLSVDAVSVPFGTEADGTHLSDHMGYVVNYRISKPS